MRKSVFVSIITIITFAATAMLLRIFSVNWPASIIFGLFVTYLFAINCFFQYNKPKKIHKKEYLAAIFLLFISAVSFLFPSKLDHSQVSWPLVIVAIALFFHSQTNKKP